MVTEYTNFIGLSTKIKQNYQSNKWRIYIFIFNYNFKIKLNPINFRHKFKLYRTKINKNPIIQSIRFKSVYAMNKAGNLSTALHM